MKTLSQRKYIISGIILLVGLIFMIKLFGLQVLNPEYKKFATNNVVRKIVQYPSRGLIYDRNMKLLVYDKAAYDLMITPLETGSFDTLLLCTLLEIDKEDMEARIQKAKDYSYYKPSVFVKQISSEKNAFLQEQLYKFRGFYTQIRTLREYPKENAAHVLGYVGEVTQGMIDQDAYYKAGDYTGISGIEKSYENEIRGVKGEKFYLVDVHNRIKGSYRDGRLDNEPVPGSNIVMGLDSELQTYAEFLMQNKRGSVVAIEPSTGEVLALLSVPDYDPNLLVGRMRGENYKKLASDTLKPIFNRALMAQYPPGSIFKMANALIALQEGTITPQTTYTCNHGYHIGSFSLGCHHDGPFDVISSISHSCNAYYCYVFRGILEKKEFGDVRNGYDKWREYMMSFGFGAKLNSDFVYELKGFVPTSEYYEKYVFKGSRWRALPIISLSIGQGELLVTPLQMANYAALIANRGYYYTPHLVKKIGNSNDIDARYSERNYAMIDENMYPEIIEGMEKVMDADGTAALSKIPEISMCGKTGTAENPHGSDHSVFMAFAPKDNPKIAISVYVENGVWGSRYAGPIASLIVEKYLNDTISDSRKWLEAKMVNANLLNSIQPE